MRISLLPLLIFAVACSEPSEGDTTSDASNFPTEPPPEPEDTGWPVGDMGNMMLVHDHMSGSTDVYAVFLDQNSFENTALCAVEDFPCIPHLPPDEDDWVDINTKTELDPLTVQSRLVGYDITLGPYEMSYEVDKKTGLGTYHTSANEAEPPVGWMGTSWSGGVWGDYEGGLDLFVSPPIEMLRPPPGASVEFQNATTVPIEWVPTGEGEVYLYVSSPFGFMRLFHLEDDGYYEVVVDDLPIGPDPEDVTFRLERWNRHTLKKYGHTLELAAVSSMTASGHFQDVGPRTELDFAATCGEAQGLLPTPGGDYWGRLYWQENELDPSCVLSGSGRDGMIKVELQPMQALAAEYTLLDGDSVAYVLDTCSPTGTCLSVGDEWAGPPDTEYLSHFNPTDESETVYVVVDGASLVDSYFYLDMTIDTLVEPEMFDECDDAMAQATPTGPGVYYSEFVAFKDDLNPGLNVCPGMGGAGGGATLSGADGMTKIQLNANETLQVQVNMPGADPGIYLVGSCTNVATCVAGADSSQSSIEQFQFQQGAGSGTYYLVVDSKSGMAPYFLTLTFTP